MKTVDVTISYIIGLVVGIIVGIAIGIAMGKSYLTKTAIENKVAHYECNEETGETMLVWGIKLLTPGEEK